MVVIELLLAGGGGGGGASAVGVKCFYNWLVLVVLVQLLQ
jgi:hypothetical protein